MIVMRDVNNMSMVSFEPRTFPEAFSVRLSVRDSYKARMQGYTSRLIDIHTATFIVSEHLVSALI